MFTVDDRDDILGTFHGNVEEFLNGDAALLGFDAKDIFLKSVEEGRGSGDLRSLIVNNICGVAVSAIPSGVSIPQHTTRVNASEYGEGDYRVSVLLSPVKASPLQHFEFRKEFSLETLTVENLISFIAGAYAAIIENTLAVANLEVVNERFATALSSENAGRNYSVRFVLDAESDSKGRARVDHVSDDEVVFVTPGLKAFEAAKLAVFSDLADIDEEAEYVPGQRENLENRNNAIESAFQNLVELLVSLDRPVDLIAARPAIIQALTDITTHKASTLIRSSFRRNISGLNKDIKKDLVVLVEHEDVIGGVKRDGTTGEFTVTLSPLDASTLAPADFDLLDHARSVMNG